MEAKEFKQRFLPLHAKLYRIAFALLGNKDDAEDILQDTYTKLWSKRHELQNIANDEAYCVTIIRNLCLDYLRSSQASLASDEDAAQKADELDANFKDPASIMEQNEQIHKVQSIIATLPRNQQQVLRLSAICDLPPAEVERITGLSNGNIRILLHRARKQILEQFNKTYK